MNRYFFLGPAQGFQPVACTIQLRGWCAALVVASEAGPDALGAAVRRPLAASKVQLLSLDYYEQNFLFENVSWKG